MATHHGMFGNLPVSLLQAGKGTPEDILLVVDPAKGVRDRGIYTLSIPNFFISS